MASKIPSADDALNKDGVLQLDAEPPAPVGRDRRSSSTTASDASVDDAFHKSGAQLAQAGPEDDKPGETHSGAAATEPGPGSATDRDARGIVAEQEIQQVENDRAVSRWMTGSGPDAPVPELPKEIAERLRPDQRDEIQDVIAAGTATRSDPETFKGNIPGVDERRS